MEFYIQCNFIILTISKQYNCYRIVNSVIMHAIRFTVVYFSLDVFL